MCTEIITQQTIEIADEPLLLRHMTVVSEQIFDFWTWPRATPRNKRPLRALPTARCNNWHTKVNVKGAPLLILHLTPATGFGGYQGKHTRYT